MGLTSTFLKGAGVVVIAGVVMVSSCQTAKDAWDNEPEGDDNKGQQIIGDATENFVDLTATSIKRGGSAIIDYTEDALTEENARSAVRKGERIWAKIEGFVEAGYDELNKPDCDDPNVMALNPDC